MEYNHFTHTNCEYFPCHKGANSNNFNCLFCFCPLYHFGNQCGGNFSYTENGIKNCENCLYPHDISHYDEIMERLTQHTN